MTGLGYDVADVADLDRSAAICGTVETIKPGTGPLQLSYCMSRRVDLSAAEFGEYWLDVHAPRHARTEGMASYRQFHGHPDWSDAAASSAAVGISTIDGIAEAHLRSTGAFEGIPPADRGDRVNFVDEATEVGMLSRIALEIP